MVILTQFIVSINADCSGDMLLIAIFFVDS